MVPSDEFAHHRRYGDYSGVVFSSTASGDDATDELLVSDRFIDPLFHAMLDRTGGAAGVSALP
ncbi:MAG: hypothetical protein MUF00_15990 [Gemmatimonadaceae bacterium]|nr:hypothetical protein [Gemmatimonadaceae bacterium]